MIFNGGRTIARLPQLKAQCSRTSIGSSHYERVPALYNFLCLLNNAQKAFSAPIYTSHQARSYATRPASRPKAHTGTAAARKPRAPKASTSATKPAQKKATTKAKPKKKTKAKKPKAKKAVAKKPKRKVLTDKQKTAKAEKVKKDKIKEMKKTALSPPKAGLSTAWLVFTSEQTKGSGENNQQRFKNAGVAYRQLSPEQREVTHTALLFTSSFGPSHLLSQSVKEQNSLLIHLPSLSSTTTTSPTKTKPKPSAPTNPS